MPAAKSFAAFVDFTYPRDLDDLASVLSAELFAGLQFVGREEAMWDEVPAVRLEKDFLGIRVELGGTPGEDGCFSIHLQPLRIPAEGAAALSAERERADLTEYLAFLLHEVPGVGLLSAPASRPPGHSG
jgi:hypothetical protein